MGSVLRNPLHIGPPRGLGAIERCGQQIGGKLPSQLRAFYERSDRRFSRHGEGWTVWRLGRLPHESGLAWSVTGCRPLCWRSVTSAVATRSACTWTTNCTQWSAGAASTSLLRKISPGGTSAPPGWEDERALGPRTPTPTLLLCARYEDKEAMTSTFDL